MILRLDIRGFLKNDDEESNDVKKKLKESKPKFGSWIMGLAAKDAKIAKNM